MKTESSATWWAALLHSLFYVGIGALISHYALGTATLGAVFGVSLQLGLGQALIAKDLADLKNRLD